MKTLEQEPQMQTTSPVKYGPLEEEMQLSAGLDYYKPTMSQVQYEQYPDAEVTFTFHNRGEQRLADYVDATVLQNRLDTLRDKSWTPGEISYFRSLENSQGDRMFTDRFLEHLVSNELPPVNVALDSETNDLAIETTGEWSLVTFWETIVMSEVNEAYFEGYIVAEGLDIMDVYDEGEHRLSEKIAILKANPDIKFSEFGTRRHFSLRWQKHVDERLLAECPDNLVGVSNVGLANSLEIKPSGTFAHEMFMVYCGIADAMGKDIRKAHNQVLEDWYRRYGNDLSIALTDTYGTDFFFEDFTKQQAEEYRATRHDSGDPYIYGEKVLAFYEENRIDPLTKTIVFSDGLDMKTIVELNEYFKGRINTVFGWGTTLTNDLGVKPLNIVMKATHVRMPETGEEADLVKLSDNIGKHTGPAAKVAEYQERLTIKEV